MTFLKTTLTGAAIAFVAGSAMAADLPSRKAPILPPPLPVFTWSGFYVGANAGATFTNRNGFTTVGAPVSNLGAAGAPGVQTAIDADLTNIGGFGQKIGAILGVQAGYNYQFASSFLVGIEADIQGIIQSSQKLSFVNNNASPTSGNPYTLAGAVTKRLDYLGTVRARLGYTFAPSFLLYVTGGLAYGQVKSFTTFFVQPQPPSTVNPAGTAAGINTTRVGYTVGAGGEWMFAPNWSLKAEYLYYDLGSVGYSAGALITGAPAGSPFTIDVARTRLRYDGHVARLGVNYHFWGPPAPVVARY